MAENESLDLGSARRWHRVLHAVGNHEPAERIASRAGMCLRKTVNALRRLVFAGGPPQVPLSDLFDALEGGPDEVKRIVRKCRGHDFAQLFHDSTLGAESREVAAERFLSAICDKFYDQIEIQIARADDQHTFTRIRSHLDQVRAHLEPELRRTACRLAADPDHALPRPRSGTAADSAVNTRSVLSESLLRIKQ